MSALQAGEESETDSEDGEVQVPQVNSDAIQAGEESETDSEEEDGKGAVVHLYFFCGAITKIVVTDFCFATSSIF